MRLLATITVLHLWVMTLPAIAGEFPRAAFPGAAGRSSAGARSLSMSLGLPIAGSMTGGGRALTVGFWIPGRNGVTGFPIREPNLPPLTTTLGQNYPNPFNPVTRIPFTIAAGASTNLPASLRVIDVSGRMVATLVDGPLTPGVHAIVWNGHDERGASVASGIYFAHLRVDNTTQTVRMTLTR